MGTVFYDVIYIYIHTQRVYRILDSTVCVLRCLMILYVAEASVSQKVPDYSEDFSGFELHQLKKQGFLSCCTQGQLSLNRHTFMVQVQLHQVFPKGHMLQPNERAPKQVSERPMLCVVQELYWEDLGLLPLCF